MSLKTIFIFPNLKKLLGVGIETLQQKTPCLQLVDKAFFVVGK